MDRALSIALTLSLMDMPWIVLYTVPFIPVRKIRIREIAWRIFLLVATIFFAVFVCGLLVKESNMSIIILVHAIAVMPALLFMHSSFNIGWSKVLYVFLFEHALATEVNLLSRHLTAGLLDTAPSVLGNPWQLFWGYLILLIVFPINWFSLKGPVRQVMMSLTDKQVRILCVTPLLFFLTGGAYSILIRQVNFTNGQAILFSLFFTFIGISAYAVNLTTTNDILKKSRLELEVVTMEQQLTRQSDRFKQFQELNAQSRQARHDLRHHLTVIHSYVKNKEYQKLEEYLEEYLSHLPKDREQQICQNFAVDVLLRDYLAKAQEAGAVIDVKIDLPDKCGIPDTQLCIVFGNLLENALHACRKQRSEEKFIRIRCRRVGNQIIASFDNSTDGKPPIRPGTGLSPIKEVVKRYHGEFFYEIENGVFQASFILQIP